MAIQLSAALTALTELKKDLADLPQDTFISWCDYINKFVYRYILGIDPERFIQSQNFTTSPNVTVYALPTNFRDMSHFGTGIYYWDQSNNLPTNRKLARTGFGYSTTGFFLNGNNINLTPPNWQQNYTFTIRFVPTQTKLSTLNQYFTIDGLSTGQPIIPDEYLDFLVKALDLRYTQWDEEPGAEGLADARFDRDLTELIKEIYREDSIFFLEDMTPYYTSNYY